MNEKQIIIEPDKRATDVLTEIWQYRDLFYFLAWRDIKVRYKQTVIGITWSVIRPVSIMIVFYIVFGRIAKLPSGEIPYPLLVFSAVLPWQFFSNTVSDSSRSLVSNAALVSKIYFPRIIIPAATMVVNAVDFLIALVLLAISLFWFGIAPGWNLVAIIPLFFITASISLGIGFFIASMNVKYRDFNYIVPFIMQFGLYISPVGFSADILSEEWRLLYSINPVVGVIDGFRWAVTGASDIYWPSIYISIVSGVVLFLSGTYFFFRNERDFADVI